MSDLLAECDWRDGTLFLVLPEDPERIGVRLFPSRYAPSRVYVPEAEIVLTKAENAKLQDERDRMYKANVEKNGEILRLLEENARLKQELESVGTAAYLYGRTDLADENAKLREQTERLVTLLRNDCDIEASWDGLRHFWSIELTEDGCLMRDRACKAEAENAKLHKLVDYMTPIALCSASERERDELRELGVEVPS